jgi:FkbM family methyltransferase
MTLKSAVRTLLPRRVHAHRILNGPLRGDRIVTSWHDYPAAILGRTEAALLGWFGANVQPGETWLDVGAHYGYTALALCKLVGKLGRVFAFEPVLATAGYLASTRDANGLNQLTVVPLGLGADQRLSLATTSIERGMATHAGERGFMTELFTIGLDQLWPSISGDDPRIHGIKIDVQGMERETVSGMFGILRRWRPRLIVELHEGVDRERMVRQLIEAGYQGTPQPIDRTKDEPNQLLSDRSYLFVPVAPS